MVSERPRKLAREIVRKVDVENGDFILIKKGSNITEDIRLFNALRNAFGATGREKVVLAVVEEFDDIKVLNEKEMASYGWCRCSSEEAIA